MEYYGKLNHVRSRAVRLAWTMSCFLCLAPFGLLLGSLSDLLHPAFPLHCFLWHVHCLASANKLTASLKNLLHLASLLLYHWLDFRLALHLASSRLLTGLPHSTCSLSCFIWLAYCLLHLPCSLACFINHAQYPALSNVPTTLAMPMTCFIWLAH